MHLRSQEIFIHRGQADQGIKEASQATEAIWVLRSFRLLMALMAFCIQWLLKTLDHEDIEGTQAIGVM